MMAWGVEARVPFLDLEFLDLAMSMDAAHKMAGKGRIEKAVLREAFAGALPRRSCGGRRSSSATASATAGSTA
jgi:asparagine synthase (glutamine-hydrolysing)